MKPKTYEQLVSKAVAIFKKDEPEWKSMDENDLYSVESVIDALLYDDEFKHLMPEDYDDGGGEIMLERLTFDAIRKLQSGKRHQCDPYYDEEFKGRDGW